MGIGSFLVANYFERQFRAELVEVHANYAGYMKAVELARAAGRPEPQSGAQYGIMKLEEKADKTRLLSWGLLGVFGLASTVAYFKGKR